MVKTVNALVCHLVAAIFLLVVRRTAGAQAQLRFETVPQDFDDVADNSSEVINGSVVLLFCSAVGETAPPSISWTRNGSDPESPPLIHITTRVTYLTNLTSSVLTIRRFSPATAGFYECQASLQGTTILSSINLTVITNGTLSVTRELTDYDTFDGDKTDWRTYVTLGNDTKEDLLSCAANYTDLAPNTYPNVTWYKDGQQLISSGTRVIITDQFNSSFTETISSVSISNFTQSDAGIYQCVFFTSTEVLTSAPLRLDTGPVSLVAVSPPLVYSSPPAPIVAEVYAQGEYSSILWSACNSTSSQYIINFGQTLVRTNPSPSDYGPYTASLVNSSNNSVTVVVTQYELPNITYISPTSYVLQGSNTNITCEAIGSPPPVISWTLNGQPTPYQSIISSSALPSATCGTIDPGETVSVLLITSFTSSGNYTCNATNVNGSSWQSVYLEVQVPPNITSPAAGFTYIVNSSDPVIFQCTASGIPLPFITFYNSSGLLNSTVDPRIIISDPITGSVAIGQQTVSTTSRSLTINSTRDGDSGNYTCVASNQGVTTLYSNQTFQLVVQLLPTITTPPANQAVLQFNSTSLTCGASGVPTPNITWWRTWSNGNSTQLVSDGQNISIKTSSSARNTASTLTIQSAQPSDAGDYTCTATNVVGSVSATANVFVQGAPRVEVSPASQVVINTNPATFACFSYANPSPVVWWVFTDAQGNSTNVSNFTTVSSSIVVNSTLTSSIVVNSTLTISSVQYQDRGQYNCTASNVIGTVSSGATLTVHVKPVVTSISNSSEVNIIQPFILQCIATGFPRPALFWMKNGANVSGGPSIFSVNITTTQLANSVPQVGSALNFTSVQRNDTANYTCIAMNAILTTLNDSQTSQLVILELPDPPINTAISQNGSRWVFLTWKAGFDGNKPITSFNIYGRNLNTSSSFQLVNSQIQTSQYLYNISSGIAPFTNYSFTVQACNLLGCGQNGSVVFVFTLQDRPDTAPSNCSISGNTSTSIGLQWLLPAIPNGIITSYNITYKPLVSRSEITLNTDPFALSCSNVSVRQNGRLSILGLNTTLLPLLKATNYMFEITAFTSVGEGPACQVNASTNDDVPEAPPVGLAAFSPTSTSIQVSWGLVPPVCRNGLILEYQVVYTIVPASGRRSLMTTRVTSPSTSTVLTNLGKFVVYSLCVQARTSIPVFGNCSVPVVVSTLNDTADAPLGVTISLGTSQGTVQWSSPTSPNGDITSYKIYYNSSIANLTNSTTATNLTLYNLSPGTEYSIGVSAINGAGEGAMSPPKIMKTLTINNGNALTGRNAGIAVGVVILAVLVIIVLVVLIYGYVWIKQRTYKKSLNEDPHVLANSYTLMPQERETLLTVDTSVAATPEPAKRPISTPKLTTDSPVPIEMFSEYVKEKHVNENWAFYDDYKMIHDGSESHPVVVSLAPENTRSNRYNNVLAFDHSRVVVKPIPGYPNDYINANYIPGYSTKKEYIAAQGPLPDTLGDFWRMVWDNNVTTIVMLTNLQENTKVKCTQYWPSSGSQVYANITVTHVDTSTFADFELRHFNIQANGSRNFRLVAQFHFVSWPDFGVPRAPVSLLHFLQRMRQQQPYGQPQPIVVHCSAGVGRTGTFLTIDVEIQRAKAERVVNAFAYIREMRRCRNLMVQTEDQYVFLHDAILEALTYCDSIIPAEKLDEKVAKLEKSRGGQTGYQTEFDAMKSPKVGPHLFTTATSPENQTKNLFSYALPYDYNIVHLHTATRYINASFVDGYYKKAYYIAAQGPLQSSVGDFWQMIWDNEIQVIVMLNQLTEDDEILCPQYWPVNLQTQEKYDSITVELLSEKSLDSYTVRKIKLTLQTSEVSNSMVIQHYHYQSWQESKAPESATGVVEMCEEVMKVQRHSGNKPIVIHCSDGVGRTGALCAVMIAIDRLKIEGVVDLQHTVRLLRTQRPNMVRKPDQYRFIYRAVREYVNSLSDYSNFK